MRRGYRITNKARDQNLQHSLHRMDYDSDPSSMGEQMPYLISSNRTPDTLIEQSIYTVMFLILNPSLHTHTCALNITETHSGP